MIVQVETNSILSQEDVSVYLDSTRVDFKIQNDQHIIVKTEDDTGFFILKIISETDKKIQITKVLIDGASLRQLIYTSYGISPDKQFCYPCTDLYQRGVQWILPFVSPVSAWIDIMLEKVTPSVIGSTLYQVYNQSYPDKFA